MKPFLQRSNWLVVLALLVLLALAGDTLPVHAPSLLGGTFGRTITTQHAHQGTRP